MLILMLVAALGFAGVVALSPSGASAKADTAPANGLPATVSDDALPTVQQNGVVWSQVTVGNIVYATGSFSQTWPAGQSASASNQTPRANLLAYNITTGALVTTFNHSLNAQGLAITASPDGSTIYVVGDFTTVDGLTRNHIAAFSTATGNLTSFAPSISASTEAIAVNSSTVYVGGNFMSAGGATRTRLAAFTTSGALLSWAPTADDNQVTALAISPDGSRVIVGGRFTTLNGNPAIGMGAVDATSGASLAFAANTTIQDGSPASNTKVGCGITSLEVSGNQVFGTGFSYNCGNFEGRFALDPNTGNINWVNDCHGDSYDAVPIGQVLYSVGHAHDCSAIGGFPDTTPRTWHRAIAEMTTASTGTNTGPDSYGWNYNGLPDSTQLDWYPALAAGTVTGQSQAAWSVTGNSNYIALGGEFPSVNGTAQAGLVRFAVSSIAPNKVGPQVMGSNWKLGLASLSSGTVRVSFPSNWDPDNTTLTYKVYRDSTSSAPIFTTTANSTFWQTPTLGFTDSGLAPGSTHQYKVFATDPFGNSTNSLWTSITVSSTGSGTTSPYAQDVLRDGANDYWRLGETSGTTAYDYAGYSDMTENNGVTQGAPGSIAQDSGTSSTFNGSNQWAATSTAIASPNTFSLAGWFNTTSTAGGMIAGFGNSNTALSSAYDRHIYLDASGHLYFGVYNGTTSTISTSGTYNDGNWHYVVATMSSAGMAFYVDGKLIGTNANVTSGQVYNGYWRIGGDNLGGWPGASSNYLAGSIDDVAVYPTALSQTQVRKHFMDAGGTIAGYVPSPSDTYGKTIYADGPSEYYRMDESAGPVANDASGNGNTGTYYGTEAFGVASPVTGGSGTAVTFSGNAGSTLATNQSQVGPNTYSEELWFNTSTTNGGKLIGFGDSQNGVSNNYDRQVYMTNSGQLVFGVYSGGVQTVTSAKSYNDGVWHQLVATQGSTGMNLYIDDQLVGSNPTTVAQPFTGYWRVGGDNLNGWPAQPSSNWFNGTIDEVAIYPTALSAAQVNAHYLASPASPTPPVASFTSNATNLAVSFDASASSSSNSIASYAWNFGDGSTGTGVTPSHSYAAAGTYSVQLTVTDANGLTNSVTHTVTVTAPAPPVASFTFSVSNLAASFNASASSSSSSISSYAWNFGDGSTGTGVTPSHTYGVAGTYPVQLTVTDANGLTNSTTQTVTVTAPNQPPVASFTATCSAATCQFNASASSDPDGTIASYAWSFGDGQTGTGQTTSHTYTAAGTDTVTLTVTDNSGASTSTSQNVTVKPSSVYASDGFARTVANGWGTADTAGGAWSAGSSSSVLSVSPGAGSLTLNKAGAISSAYLPSVSTTNSDTTAVVTPTVVASSGMYIDVIARRVSSTIDYRARVHLLANGTVGISLLANNAGTQTAIKGEIIIKGLTYTPGTQLSIRVQAVGSGTTTVQAKVWATSSTQPSAWQVSTTDTTAALQAAGSVGMSAFLPSSATNAPISAKVSSFLSQSSGN